MIILYRPLKSVSAACITFMCLLLISPVLISGTGDSYAKKSATFSVNYPRSNKETLQDEARALYESIQLKRFGLNVKAFELAYQGYKHLLQTGKLYNKEIISICDFSQSSRRKRLYIINVEEKKVLVNTYVAHGRKSGGEYARSFSNNPESHKSSLGFYITRKTYYGGHGLALTIDGLERGINDRANERNIVVHGSDYVGSDFIRGRGFNGRSYGCPAVPAKETNKVIHTIKDGSCLFIYHPTKNYISNSKILND